MRGQIEELNGECVVVTDDNGSRRKTKTDSRRSELIASARDWPITSDVTGLLYAMRTRAI